MQKLRFLEPIFVDKFPLFFVYVKISWFFIGVFHTTQIYTPGVSPTDEVLYHTQDTVTFG